MADQGNKPLKRVYADGAFDMFHLGHMTYLHNVRSAFDEPIFLIVGVCSDETVESYKRRPVLNFEIRKNTIIMSKLADEVIEAPLKATLEFVTEHNIDFVTHGSDWSEEQVEEYYGLMRSLGKLKIVPHTPGICTSDIIRAIKSRDDL